MSWSAVALAELDEAVGLRRPGARQRRHAVGWCAAAVRGRPSRPGRAGSTQAVADVPGLEVCGAAYAGVGIPAVIANAQAAATRVVQRIGPVGTMGA